MTEHAAASLAATLLYILLDKAREYSAALSRGEPMPPLLVFAHAAIESVGGAERVQQAYDALRAFSLGRDV